MTPEGISQYLQGEAPFADLCRRRYLDSDQSYQRERNPLSQNIVIVY
jgi:hypothetical protein